MENEQDEVKELLAQLRSAAGSGRFSPGAGDLLDRLETAIDKVISDADALRSRLERPPLNSMVTHASPARLEAWARKLEQRETTSQ